MQNNIQSPHLTPDESLTDFVNKKAGKLPEFNERIVRAEVCLKFDKSGKDDDKVCEIRLITPGKNFFAGSRCLTFTDAVTQTVKALEQQIKKKKTKRDNRKLKLVMDKGNL